MREEGKGILGFRYCIKCCFCNATYISTVWRIHHIRNMQVRDFIPTATLLPMYFQSLPDASSEPAITLTDTPPVNTIKVTSSDTKPNVAGIVILTVVATILVLVFIGLIIVHRCFGYRPACIQARNHGPNKEEPAKHEQLQGGKPLVSDFSRPSTTTVPITPPSFRIARGVYIGSDSTCDHTPSSDTSSSIPISHSTSVSTYKILTPPPGLHQDRPFDERSVASSISSRNLIRPHGMPPLAEDKAVIFSPYFRIDEHILYGSKSDISLPR